MNADLTRPISKQNLYVNRLIEILNNPLFSLIRNSVPYEQQVIAFEAQLNIANERNVPLVIHCRDAEAEVFEIMKKVSFSPLYQFLFFKIIYPHSLLLEFESVTSNSSTLLYRRLGNG